MAAPSLPYECPHCGCRFAGAGMLADHIHYVHGCGQDEPVSVVVPLPPGVRLIDGRRFYSAAWL